MAWHRSTSGPDWTDISVHLNFLEELYKCEVSLLICPVSGTHGSEVYVVASAALKPQTPWVKETIAVTQTSWPHRDHATIEGAAVAVLLKLEEAIEQYQLRGSASGIGAARVRPGRKW